MGRQADVARDVDRRAVSPLALTRLSWRYTARLAVREFVRDHCIDLAGALTFRAVLAIAPALLVLVSMLGVLVDGTEAVQRLLDVASRLGVPDGAIGTLEPVVRGLADRPGAGWGLAGGLALALWSASGYVATFGRAMNQVYDVEEGRPLWKLRPQMLLVTVVTLVVAAAVVVALVLTDPVAQTLGSLVGLGDTAVAAWRLARWPVAVVLVAVLVAFLYWATPNVRQPRFRWVTVGSGLALLVWIAATWGFGVYVSRAGSYEATYGALAGVILLFLWLFLTNAVLLLGAEVDAELTRARQLQAGMAAEERLLLPLRSTRTIRRRREQQEEEVARGRLLRLTGGTMQPPLERARRRRRRDG